MQSVINQILIGSLIIPVTILVQVIFIQFAITQLRKLEKIEGNYGTAAVSLVLSASTLWLLAALSIAIWIWAGFFLYLGCFANIEQSLYFSMVAFTTLGFGDLTLPQEWRILSGMIAANGLVLFGLNTAFLIEVLHRTIVRERRKT